MWGCYTLHKGAPLSSCNGYQLNKYRNGRLESSIKLTGFGTVARKLTRQEVGSARNCANSGVGDQDYCVRRPGDAEISNPKYQGNTSDTGPIRLSARMPLVAAEVGARGIDPASGSSLRQLGGGAHLPGSVVGDNLLSYLGGSR